MSEWTSRKLGELIAIKHGFAFKGEYFGEDEAGPILVTPGNFAIGGGFKQAKTKSYAGQIPEEFALAPGDLVVTMTDLSKAADTLGYPALIPEGLTYLHNQRIGKVEISNAGQLDKGFLYYALRVDDYRRHVVNGATGTTVKHTSPTRICEYVICLPSLSEQRAIASVLGALDDKIAVNERIAMTADALSHALFHGKFRSSVQEDRADWMGGHLSDLCSTQYGYTASSAPDPAVGPKFLRVKDINKNNWITWSDVPHCEISGRDAERYRLNVGDVLVARMADPGKSAIIEDRTDAVFASYLVRLKMPSLAHSYFVWGFLKSDAYARYVESSRGGSVQANMNAKVIVGAPLVIPPVEVMEQYLCAVRPVRERLNLALRESRQLAVLRDTLLPQLMSGRLRIKDAEKIVEDAT